MVTHIKNNTLHVEVKDDILAANAVQIRDQLRTSISTAADDVTDLSVDISHSQVIDSRGLNLLVGLYKEATQRDWGFRLTGASPDQARLFNYINLSETFGL